MDQGRIPLVLTYSSYLPDTHKIVKKNMNILQKSKRMTDVFRSPPIVAYKRSKNFRDILIHGKLKKQKGIIQSSRCSGPCDTPGCKTCMFLPQSEMFQGKDTTYSIYRGGNCNTKNVVYLISCGKCNQPVYVGETGRSIKERVKEHIWDIRAFRDKPVSIHFNSSAHSENDIKFNIIESINNNKSTIYRRIREEFWINKLQTWSPIGLNIKTK